MNKIATVTKENYKGKMVNLCWNPQRNQEQPFWEVEQYGDNVYYRGKQIVLYKTNYYTINKWTWDFNPNLDNNISLMPATNKCMEYLKGLGVVKDA